MLMQKLARRPRAYMSARVSCLPGGDQDDDGEEDGVGDMDAVEGLAPVGGDEPVEAVAVGHPLDEFAGGHKRGVHRHDQGEAGQGRHRHPEGQAVQDGGVMGDEVAFVQVKIDGRGQGQGGHDGGHQAHGAGQKDVGLADLPPAPHQAGGLEHGFHPGVGQDAEGDVGDEDVVALEKGARVQVGAGLEPQPA